MDLLSDVVALMRTGQPVSALVTWRAPWGVAVPAEPGSAAFQVVLRGSCWLIPPSGEPVPLSVGDVVFLPHGHGYGLADSPGTPLAAGPCEPSEGGALFSSTTSGGTGAETVTVHGSYRKAPGRAHPLLGTLPEVIHLPTTLGRHPELRAAVELLGNEIAQRRPGADTVVTSLLDMLQLYILRAWFETTPGKCEHTGWAVALSDPAISRALDAAHRDPAHRWTVAELAGVAGLSRAAFARRFAELVGQPPLAYLTWWRLATAARLLRESDAPVSAVAAQVGYGSEFAFGTAFKREFGIAPGRYQRQACEEVKAEQTGVRLGA
ncbi:AraC family transcriptional regulator [Actinomadura sp. ATCC 31491]|uniref:AraC family transcriptional regulator n=1 Tax=Actinomadura luzonensis TaxID=2805427 RepID=A0ABT0G8R9_9ACTN|nr:AraC family transcriptional regulator [Actinomadura luzonensis]MCK2220987.1 AraC family transcriptional regulator [Actinomadura luzonensis]